MSLQVYEISGAFRRILVRRFAGVFIRLAAATPVPLLRYPHAGRRGRNDAGRNPQACFVAVKLVEVTGGEPLFQSETPMLTTALMEKGYQVLVETNGSLDISVLPEGVIRIMDIKCPASGESHRVMWENLWKLRPDDEVKFVISDRHDYEWARGIILERFEQAKTKILFSTVFGELPPGTLWNGCSKIEFRPASSQIHKYMAS
jgi:organic radical activating enzyme